MKLSNIFSKMKASEMINCGSCGKGRAKVPFPLFLHTISKLPKIQNESIVVAKVCNTFQEARKILGGEVQAKQRKQHLLLVLTYP